MLHACKLSSVRSDPSEHLQMAIEHIKAPTDAGGNTTSILYLQLNSGDPNQPN